MSIDTRNKDYSVLLIGAPEDVHQAEESLSRLYDWTILGNASEWDNHKQDLLLRFEFLIFDADAVVTIDDEVALAYEQALVLLAMHLGLDILTYAEAVDMYEFIKGGIDCE